MMPPMVTRAGTQQQRATKYNNFRSGEITALTYHLKRRVLLEVVKLLSQLNVSKIVQRQDYLETLGPRIVFQKI